jgi:HEAT repeat protein
VAALHPERPDRRSRSLAENLFALRRYRASSIAVPALIALTVHVQWHVRMEAARLLGRAVNVQPNMLACLERLLADDRDPDVKAHAAYGLWLAAGRDDKTVITTSCRLWTSSLTRPTASPDLAFVSTIVQLLEDGDPGVRMLAAKTLGAWEQREEAVPALAPAPRRPGLARAVAGGGDARGVGAAGAGGSLT